VPRQRGQQLDETLLELPEARPADDGDDDHDFDPDEDPLLDKAIEIVCRRRRRPVSLLQRAARRLHRAGRPDRHARAARDHLRLRGLEAAAACCSRSIRPRLGHRVR
jgi:hypothetical protein